MIMSLYMNSSLLKPMNCLLNRTIYNYYENITTHTEIPQMPKEHLKLCFTKILNNLQLIKKGLAPCA